MHAISTVFHPVVSAVLHYEFIRSVLILSRQTSRVLLMCFRLWGRVLFSFLLSAPFLLFVTFIPALRFFLWQSARVSCRPLPIRKWTLYKPLQIIFSLLHKLTVEVYTALTSSHRFWAHFSPFIRVFVRFSRGNGANCCSHRPQKKIKRRDHHVADIRGSRRLRTGFSPNNSEFFC